ncbi:glucosyltransferase domain-containing protein [Kushneria phosphatilytica]|uniref:glucosyltransferase domain-containing protein n=1 Tax=Kushneria phosphatilytica TaxID=657387 RepID=UPI0008DAE9FD|nr:glucosyltransferase domain-containing protein [Kushneria phosphatilytica]OHV13020.1 hypothetical protein BH688_03185 [Kushneria phosphatilytica]
MIETFKDKLKRDKNYFIASFFAVLVAYYALINSGYYYQDDRSRFVYGFTGWSGQARPFSDLFMRIFEVNGHLSDATPIPQIISALLIASCSILIIRSFERIDKTIATMAALLLFLNPFYLQNFSYRFDNLLMTTSVFLVVFSFYCASKNKKPWTALSVTACFLSLCTYQPAVNVFMQLSAAYSTYLIFHKIPKPLKQFLRLTAIFLSSLLIYKIGISLFMPGNKYTSAHSSMASIGDAPTIIEKNIGSFAKIFAEYSDNYFLFLISAIFAIFLFMIVYHSIKNREIKYIACFLYLSISLFFSAGLLALLEEPVFEPRVMLGVGGFASSMILSIPYARKKGIFAQSTKIALSINFLFFSITANAYGNALSYLAKFEHAYFRDIYSNAYEQYVKNDASGYSIIGKNQLPQALVNKEEHDHKLSYLFNHPLDGYWSGKFADSFFKASDKMNYMKISAVDSKVLSKVKKCELNHVERHLGYNIYSAGNLVFVDFDKKCD